MLNTQASLFDMLTPEHPASVKGWTLTKQDSHTVNATDRTGSRHTIHAYQDMFSPDRVTWDIPAELPQPVREAAVKLLSEPLELACE